MPRSWAAAATPMAVRAERSPSAGSARVRARGFHDRSEEAHIVQGLLRMPLHRKHKPVPR
ncbi:hypothetical protein BST39_16010 [Mycobacterium paraseoulense]|uniref:Uncharacterized protein n=1 Tax=Mycobacterium paraseoulense TaxID=590652 RepID=A0A1X0I8S3_9MYCO|nr:hypothetical protein BST39_16010 [Mycobacterium paraseoulense]